MLPLTIMLLQIYYTTDRYVKVFYSHMLANCEMRCNPFTFLHVTINIEATHLAH